MMTMIGGSSIGWWCVPVACLLALQLSPSSGTLCPTNGPPSNATWRFTTSFPPGCNGTACSYFLGVRTNEDAQFLDFMMEGKADGWIAVGYTPNQGMPDADVFVCALIGGQVTILDTYNIPIGRSNVMDSSQDLCPSSMSFVNGRIRCVFSRAVQTGDLLQDLDLLDGSYFQLIGWTDSDISSMDVFDSLQIITREVITPTTNATNTTINNSTLPVVLALIQAHGILMIVAWPTVYVTANLFGILMQPSLPGTPMYWVRRAAQVITLISGIAAALCIFVAQKAAPALGDFSNPEVATHFVLGIIMIVLNVINPILSCTPRCSPRMKDWMIQIVLVPCTVLAIILSLINIAIGLSLFEDNLNITTVAPSLAIFLAFIGFFVAVITFGFVFYTLLAIIKGSSELAPSVIWPLFHSKSAKWSPDSSKVEVLMTSPAPPGNIQAPDPAAAANFEDNSPYKDSPLKWAGIIAYVVVMVPMMVAVIILIAVFK